MQGQAHVFYRYAPVKIEYAIGRYQRETRRLYEVLDRQLKDNPYLAGEFSIADIACWPWVSRFEWQQIELAEFSNVRAWYLRIAERPAVQRGYHKPHFVNDIPMP